MFKKQVLFLVVILFALALAKDNLADEYAKTKNKPPANPPRSKDEAGDDDLVPSSGSKDSRKGSIFRGPQRVLITVASPNNSTTNRSLILSFACLDVPRIGIEWGRDNGLVNGTKNPDVAYSVRLVGMAEVNTTYSSPADSPGTKYRFERFRWTNIQAARNVSVPGSPVRVQTFWSVGTFGSISVNVSISVSADPLSSNAGWTLGPNAIKYSVNITGAPVYKLSPSSNSSWKFFKAVFSSSDKVNFTKSTLSDNVQRLDWLSTLLADGVNRTITVDDLNTTNIEPGARFEGNDSSVRENDLDSRLRFRTISWNVPYFNSSLFWDPSISIDDSQAAVQADAGSFDVSRSSRSAIPSLLLANIVVISLIVLLF